MQLCRCHAINISTHECKHTLNMMASQEVSTSWAGPLHTFFASHNYHLITGLYGDKNSGYMGVALALPVLKYVQGPRGSGEGRGRGYMAQGLSRGQGKWCGARNFKDAPALLEPFKRSAVPRSEPVMLFTIFAEAMQR